MRPMLKAVIRHLAIDACVFGTIIIAAWLWWTA